MLPELQRVAGPSVGIALDVDRAAPAVWVDQRQLTAALASLVANGRDALGAAGSLTIRVSAQEPARTRIEVIDEGCGMSAEVLARSTEPFFTTRAVGAGAGLGLSMVDGFVRQSGGELRFASEPGRGTTVTLLLPAAPH